ncbi:MAG: type II secretion system protein [Bdellovibrionaceae bacterium]|nr:type II secretion system protein [Pseudobdellovibrionaceae bacterium]
MKYHSRSGFTLVELLVVITIVGILITLTVPTVGGAMEKAKKVEAGVMVQQLRVAMNAYYTEYGRWPRLSERDVWLGREVYPLLIGRNEPASENPNPREIRFIEIQSKVLRNSDDLRKPVISASEADTFVDPWNQEYFLSLDLDYNNEIDLPQPFIGEANAPVIIWSIGKQKDLANLDRDAFIKSW